MALVTRFTHKLNASSTQLNSVSEYDGRIGFWADVESVDPENYWCTVISDTRLRFYDIPVMTKQWVCKKENFVSAESDLPPVGARVFVLCPTDNIADAFIIGSGFPGQETGLKTILSSDGDEKKKVISRSGWSFQEDDNTGEIIITSLDSKIQINCKPNSGSDKKDGQILINAFEQSFKMTNDSVLINGNLEVLK